MGGGPGEGEEGRRAAWQRIRLPASSVLGWGERVLPLPSPRPVKPLIHRGGEGRPTRGGPGAGTQSLSDPTAEDPFRFRLVGFGFVSSSSWRGPKGDRQPDSCCPTPLPPRSFPALARGLTEALLEPDSSSALGG